MAILKLANPNDEATLNVTGCEMVEGNFGPQIKIDADNGDTLYVPEASFIRQMDRMGIAEPSDAVGKTLHFFRAPNSKPGGKPFWNIDRARPEDKPTPASNGKPAVATALLPNENGSEPYLQETGGAPIAKVMPTTDTASAAHWQAFQDVLTKYVPAALAAGAEVSVDVNALTYQLYEARRTAR
jgi:hypothetical protein